MMHDYYLKRAVSCTLMQLEVSETALVPDRHDWLLQQLAQRRRLSTNAIADELGVSVDTIRRDFRVLHERGQLRRVHGGAVQISPLSPSFTGRTSDASPERARLADAIAQQFRPGQVIGLDAGTTTTEIASRIAPSLAVTIVTNNPVAATVLADHQHASVILIGGDVDLQWMATTGPAAVDTIRSHHLDLAIVGVCSFDLTAGATTRSQHEIATKQALIASAAVTLVPLEADKFGTVAPFALAGPTDVGLVVSADRMDSATVAQCRTQGVEVTTI